MLVSLGKVSISNIDGAHKKRATDNEAVPSATYLCHSVMIEAWPYNAARVFICDRESADRNTGVGVVAVLGIPTENSIPTFTDTMTGAANAINLERLWIDADQAGDGVLVVADVA